MLKTINNTIFSLEESNYKDTILGTNMLNVFNELKSKVEHLENDIILNLTIEEKMKLIMKFINNFELINLQNKNFLKIIYKIKTHTIDLVTYEEVKSILPEIEDYIFNVYNTFYKICKEGAHERHLIYLEDNINKVNYFKDYLKFKTLDLIYPRILLSKALSKNLLLIRELTQFIPKDSTNNFLNHISSAYNQTIHDFNFDQKFIDEFLPKNLTVVTFVLNLIEDDFGIEHKMIEIRNKINKKF